MSYKLAKWSCLKDNSHPYAELFPKRLPEQEIVEIEEKYKIRLPEGYRSFLEEIANGGPGPYGELWPIEDSLAFMDYYIRSNPDFLSLPFPLKKSLNLCSECSEGLEFDDCLSKCQVDPEYQSRVNSCVEYHRSLASFYRQGTLPIGEYGCGIFYLLVVSSDERGSVWIDDFANDWGLSPLSQYPDRDVRVDFLTWYENWLDEQLGARATRSKQHEGILRYGFVDG